jgi:hypothetical protein
MKKIIALTMAFILSVSLMACGNTDTETVSTEESTENVATYHTVDVTTEHSETVEQLETTENFDSLKEEPTEAEDIVIEEDTEVLPLSYDDCYVEGYGNFVDGYANGERIRLTISASDGWESSYDTVIYDATSYRGIAIGDSKEKVLELYGEPYNIVTYMNDRYEHNGLLPQYNINYAYVDDRFPDVFFCLSFNMDQNDNVSFVLLEAIDMKWY